MLLDLSRFKVIYGNRVLNAVALEGIDFGDLSTDMGEKCLVNSKFISVFAINEDGNIILIRDDAWRFQFVPNVGR